MRCSRGVLPAILLGAAAGTAWAHVGFQGIGIAPEMHNSYVAALSADGSTVVGWSQRPGTIPPVHAGPSHLIRWRAGVLHDLGDAPPLDQLEAVDVSADGNVISATGSSTAGGGPAAFRWAQAGGAAERIPVPGLLARGGPVSADGGSIVGHYSLDGYPPFGTYRWTASQGVTLLPDEVSNVSDMSPDGRILIGHRSGQAFLWTEEAGLESLGPVPGGWTGSRPRAISDDTRVVVGILERGVGIIEITPYRWTRAGGYELLTPGPGDSHSTALACSADGALVVGQMSLGGSWTAAIWLADGSYRTMADHLAGYGLDTSGWVLTGANNISADGRTFAGNGHRIDGPDEGWIATVPAPGTCALPALGLLTGRRRQG